MKVLNAISRLNAEAVRADEQAGAANVKMLFALMIAHALLMAAVPAGFSAAQGGTCENRITQSTRSAFRDFIGENGKTCRGRVRAYNPNNETVTITKENGDTLQVNLSILSKTDQTYVREWDLINVFFSQNRFHVSARTKQSRGRMQLLVWRPEEEIVYSILLKNRSNYALTDLTLDYCIYDDLYRSGSRESMESQGVKCGTLKIGTLAAGENMRAETQPVIFPRKGDGFEYYQGNQVPAGRTGGIWVRIYLPLAGNRRAMREFALPNSIMKTRRWTMPSSQNNGQEN